jgi:anthranilate phosphoribosyltransferase
VSFEDSLNRLLTEKDLSEQESYKTFCLLFEGRVKEPQAKALLLLLAWKGETATEVLGCLRAIRFFEPAKQVRIPHLMDTCGTGGDRSHSFNISTLAAFVIAGAGGKVAKHGNRAISSKSGSSDLMEALGVRLQAPRKNMITAIRRYGIGYFHAPLYHPLFLRLQPLRRRLGTPTIFNLLGPLLNPLALEAQLIGVAKRKYLSLFATVLKKTVRGTAMAVSSADGMDEISTSAKTSAVFIQKGRTMFRQIQPKRLGFLHAAKHSYKGGTVRKNRNLALRLLSGRLKGPVRDIVILNAAAGLFVSGLAKNLREGIRLAEKSIDSGSAYRALKGLKRMSQMP